eukprot:CAMPEP_0185771644 /NCGR_PEP_ID=MMETSP1174-20130828/64431_1 /TAXON_ID=35687 /ORGANISM="Dictyocha speculum, Strain CCMP1381" /LENGTH=107 /DNA_ID=CAMNT_0028457551 /DNA_START=112 /DNA_END=435 /DNA_ORIENTATION=+
MVVLYQRENYCAGVDAFMTGRKGCWIAHERRRTQVVPTGGTKYGRTSTNQNSEGKGSLVDGLLVSRERQDHCFGDSVRSMASSVAKQWKALLTGVKACLSMEEAGRF